MCTLVFSLAALLCYAVLPDSLPSQPFLYERYGVFVLLGLVSVVSWAMPVCWNRFARAFRTLVLCAALGYSLHWLAYCLEFRPVALEFARFFPRGKEFTRSLITALIDEPDFRGAPSLIHFNNYQIIWNGGVTPTCLVQYRFGIVGEGARKLPPHDEWLRSHSSPSELAWRIYLYNSSDYLVVHGKRPYDALVKRSDYVLVRKSETWALFRHLKRLVLRTPLFSGPLRRR